MLTKNHPAPEMSANSISDQYIDLYGLKGKKVIVKFHRFSGCPVARYQVHEFIKRQKELSDAGIETIVILHSSKGKTISNFNEAEGLHIVADKEKTFYRLFHSQFLWMKLFSMASWRAMFASFLKGYFPQFNKFEGGIIGIPSDFLINEKGIIVDLNYGKHIGDSWTVSEVLSKLRSN
jgi:thioredoxin-dependent peroxiredoxin